MSTTEAMTTSTITTKTLASSTTTPAIPPPSFLAHVVLQTSTANFDAMVHFYTTMLSAQHTYTTPTAAFMTYDEEHHRLAILASPDVQPKDPKTAGLRHIAFSYDTLADLVAGYKGRKAAGFEPVWCVDHGISTSMYYEDPDGNRLECQVDNMSKEEAIRYMASETFTKNPLGVDYQPEELVKRFESGEEWVGFLKRAQEERGFGEHK
ncbi:glyoxalase/Bleomycin resistance protein/Dioxygenase superfamily protein [Phyllosticta capitalensis]|uniref:Glyoxalase/Bleomycin resistance protein/Dioxygenase superfamily protein n=1 Tax=Phyllosticta capitalensis TaxID=121624 RepID=A0ABR1Z4S2_9PEZI